jgi:hypothetical protein
MDAALLAGGTSRNIWFETRCWLGVVGGRNGVGRASIRAVDFPDHRPAYRAAADRQEAMAPDLQWLHALTQRKRKYLAHSQ